MHSYLLHGIKISMKNINVKVEASHFKMRLIGLLYNYKIKILHKYKIYKILIITESINI